MDPGFGGQVSTRDEYGVVPPCEHEHKSEEGQEQDRQTWTYAPPIRKLMLPAIGTLTIGENAPKSRNAEPAYPSHSPMEALAS